MTRLLLFLLFAGQRKEMRTGYGRLLQRILCCCFSCRGPGAVRFCCCLVPEEQCSEYVNNPELPDPDPGLLQSEPEEQSA
jgi:hypothetical protein